MKIIIVTLDFIRTKEGHLETELGRVKYLFQRAIYVL